MKQLNRFLRKRFRLNLIALALIGLGIILPFPAPAVTVNVAANYTDIQNAINAASPGDVIQVAAGTVTLGATEMITIPNAQLGIQLIGAGKGVTIIERASGSTSFPLLLIGGSTSCSISGATLIEGFTFRNSGLTSGSTTSSTAAYRGIEIRSCGGSTANPAIIRNNEFLWFRDTGISIVDYPFAYWEFSGNTFDGSRLAIWINSADFVTIHGNTFQNYVVAVGFDPNDVVTDLAITENKLLGGSFDPAPANYYGLYISTASAAAGDPKNWDISGNEITGSTFGVRLLAPTSGGLFQSLANVSMQDNCIYDNNVLGNGGFTTTYGVYNTSTLTLDAINNWWGDASGPNHASNPGGAGDLVSDNVSFTPWSTVQLPACGGGGPTPTHPYVLLANDDVKLYGMKDSEGDVHANESVEFYSGISKTLTGNVSAVEYVEIAKKNTINGDVTAGIEVENKGTVTGTITQGAAVAVVPLPAVGPFTAGVQDIEVPKKGALSLPPGDYREIKVKQQATLTLTSGVYNLKQIEMEQKARLVIDIVNGAPATINLVEEMELGKEVKVIINNGDSEELAINSTYASTMTFRDKSVVQGTIIAPAARVVLGKKTAFKGSICADDIEVLKEACFLAHGSATPLPKVLPGEDEEEGAITALPTVYELSQNYPNPFNPATTIRFALPEAGTVSLKIYNIRGQLVKTLVSGHYEAGYHQVQWNAANEFGDKVASGFYFYTIQAGGFHQVKKMLLIK